MTNQTEYIKKFNLWVQTFLKDHHLFDLSRKHVVAVSGGVDSLVLMFVLKSFFPNLKVLHINHGTRAECEAEEKLVQSYANRLGIELDIIRFSLSLDESNFESIARNMRASIYKQYISKGFFVYTAHHIDDSFEWSLIQSFKQSSVKSTLGIPLYNQGLIRPFMCVSKLQILKYASLIQIKWASDASNKNERFERNYFRNRISPSIFKRYPSSLRNYVSHHNQLAFNYNLHTKQKFEPKKSFANVLLEIRESSGGVVLKSRDFSLHKEEIKEWIHFFSKKTRGEIDRELEVLISAQNKFKSDPKDLKFKGPFSFSGSVKAYLFDKYLLLMNDSHLDYYHNLDAELVATLDQRISQITFGAKYEKSKLVFPYLCLISPNQKKFGAKFVHPLLPKTCNWLKAKRIPYSFYPLLTKKGYTNPAHNTVLLDSSFLDL